MANFKRAEKQDDMMPLPSNFFLLTEFFWENFRNMHQSCLIPRPHEMVNSSPTPHLKAWVTLLTCSRCPYQTCCTKFVPGINFYIVFQQEFDYVVMTSAAGPYQAGQIVLTFCIDICTAAHKSIDSCGMTSIACLQKIIKPKFRIVHSSQKLSGALHFWSFGFWSI